MLVATVSEIPGKRIAEVIGMVRGSTVRARHVGHDFMAKLRNVVGGEITDYTKMIAEAREEALDRMVSHARSNGANAVICVRFSTSEVMEGAAEILVYGTAVIMADD